MDAVHDIAPDILVEGGPSVAGGQLLVVITAAPDAGGIVRCKAYEPDIVIGGGSTALAGS